MTEYLLCNLRTGKRILSVPVMQGPWDDRLGAAETVSVTVDMNDPDVQALDLRNSGTPAQSALCVVEDGVIMAGGPVWVRSYNRDSKTFELNAKGMASYFDHRIILPLLAKTIGVDQWTIPDPSDATKTIANPDLTTTYSNLSLGTIAKRLVQQAQTWTGGNLPIVFQADEIADATRTYLGVDFKSVGEALDQLSKVENGPEINFHPRFTSDMLGVEWVLQFGTVAQPLITSTAVLAWNVTAPESPISNLSITDDASSMGSLAWQTGGRQADTVLVARSYDSSLVDSGFPLLELTDTSHSSVEFQSTLDTYAKADTASGKRSTEVWSFTAKARPVDQFGKPAGPFVGQYAVGDFVDLIFDAVDKDTGTGGFIQVVTSYFTDVFSDMFGQITSVSDPIIKGTGGGDPYLPEGGTFRQRIVGISGDEKSIDIRIQCEPRLAG